LREKRDYAKTERRSLGMAMSFYGMDNSQSALSRRQMTAATSHRAG
jgi:hypothetical protein